MVCLGKRPPPCIGFKLSSAKARVRLLGATVFIIIKANSYRVLNPY